MKIIVGKYFYNNDVIEKDLIVKLPYNYYHDDTIMNENSKVFLKKNVSVNEVLNNIKHIKNISVLTQEFLVIVDNGIINISKTDKSCINELYITNNPRSYKIPNKRIYHKYFDDGMSTLEKQIYFLEVFECLLLDQFKQNIDIHAAINISRSITKRMKMMNITILDKEDKIIKIYTIL